MRFFFALLLVCGPLKAFSPPAWSLNQPIYEVNLETFSESKNFKGLEARLPELKALGVGILWIMPIYTRGIEKAFGSPYCVKDFKGLHAPFGSEADLKQLVARAHQLGLRVILDWVANHSSWDNALTKSNPEFYEKSNGQIKQAHGWNDVAQLNYKNEGLRAVMIESMAYWVKNFDIDGFRCDVVWGVPVDFWVSARAALEKIKPLFMLAESNDAKYAAAFDADYDWNLAEHTEHSLLMKIRAGVMSAKEIDLQLEKEKAYPPGFMRMRYTSNHDEWWHLGLPQKRFGESLRAFAVLTALLPGKPLIYNGQEIGWNQKDGVIQWSQSPEAFYWRNFYARLFRLHQANAAAWKGSFLKLKSGADRALYAFQRQSGEDKILVLINLSKSEQNYVISDPAISGQYMDLFSGARESISGTKTGKLAPWAYQVLWRQLTPR